MQLRGVVVNKPDVAAPPSDLRQERITRLIKTARTGEIGLHTNTNGRRSHRVFMSERV